MTRPCSTRIHNGECPAGHFAARQNGALCMTRVPMSGEELGAIERRDAIAAENRSENMRRVTAAKKKPAKVERVRPVAKVAPPAVMPRDPAPLQNAKPLHVRTPDVARGRWRGTGYRPMTAAQAEAAEIALRVRLDWRAREART